MIGVWNWKEDGQNKPHIGLDGQEYLLSLKALEPGVTTELVNYRLITRSSLLS